MLEKLPIVTSFSAVALQSVFCSLLFRWKFLNFQQFLDICSRRRTASKEENIPVTLTLQE